MVYLRLHCTLYMDIHVYSHTYMYVHCIYTVLPLQLSHDCRKRSATHVQHRQVQTHLHYLQPFTQMIKATCTQGIQLSNQIQCPHHTTAVIMTLELCISLRGACRQQCSAAQSVSNTTTKENIVAQPDSYRTAAQSSDDSYTSWNGVCYLDTHCR